MVKIMILNKIKSKFLGIFISILSLLLLSCANTATNPTQNKVMQFSFNVQGNMILNRSDITYYVVFYAPTLPDPTVPLDTNIGPRINSPNVTVVREILEGRLPFVHQLPGDQETKWTDFFYITGKSDGVNTEIGRGKIQSDGKPIIYDRNYANTNTKPLTDPATNKINGYQIEFILSDLNNGQGTNASTITANIATSDNIDNGWGMIFDSWKGNVPFSISLESQTLQTEQDVNTALVMKKIISRPDPILPAGVSAEDVNIVKFTARITE